MNKFVKTMEQFLFESDKPEIKFECADEFCIFDDMVDEIDLTKIPKDEIKKQCINYSFYRERYLFASPLSELFQQQRLNEDITSTISIDDAIHAMKSKYNLKDWQFFIKDGTNDIKVLMIIPNIYQNVSMVIEDMISMGYYERFIEYDCVDNNWFAFIRFDPKFTKDITSIVKKMKYIKHWTPQYNFESIKENGFIPKSLNSKFHYPPSVHFLIEDIDDTNLFTCVKDLCDNNKNPQNNKNYILLTIDTSLIPDNVKFYYDSCYKFGIKTYDSIPFDCVIKTEDFKVR